jgi:hypothetical protein
MKLKIFAVHAAAFFLLAAFFGNAQAATQKPVPTAASPSQAAAKALPRGFDGVELGFSLDRAKEELIKNNYFRYRGDPDVSFLPKRREVLIETEGASFIKRGFFQFNEEKLYTIILMLNPAKVDFYSLYTSSLKKYGDPKELNPRTVVWEDDSVRFVLEKPLTVKYIYKPVFDDLVNKAKIEKSYQEIAREEFLGLF